MVRQRHASGEFTAKARRTGFGVLCEARRRFKVDGRLSVVGMVLKYWVPDIRWAALEEQWKEWR